jgi:hypothetical protein
MSRQGSDNLASRRSPLLFLARSPLATLRDYVRSFHHRPIVRPWALAAPIVVLLVALPLLRPLRHPADVSADEALRLASIEALVRSGTLQLTAPPTLAPTLQPIVPGSELDRPDTERLLEVNGRLYSNQPPVMAVLLSAPAWLMRKMGFNFRANAAVVAYVLTLLGVTLPVAGAAGLVYRMGRLFELTRPWRTGLAFAVVAGSGLLSYAVVLNPHAPAAVLLLCAAACQIHVTLARLKRRGASWVLLSGICAALAATLDPAAGAVGLLLMGAILAMRMTVWQRLAMVVIYLIGAAGPIAMHASWSRPVTGEVIPGVRHLQRVLATAQTAGAPVTKAPAIGMDEPDADEAIPSPARWAGHGRWMLSALFGAHGLLTHFPVLLLGIAGIGAVMHRHWPSFVKTLAAATGTGAAAVIVLYAIPLSDFREAMFATRWFVVFAPLLLFWCGAWLRRTHSHLSWSLAGAMLVFSMTVGILGMTEPYPRDGFTRYTAAQALHRLVQSTPSDPLVRR